ncbi:MAG: hypothetical protein WC740_21320, partial [Verrucomicrobiia bacterium]
MFRYLAKYLATDSPFHFRNTGSIGTQLNPSRIFSSSVINSNGFSSGGSNEAQRRAAHTSSSMSAESSGAMRLNSD